MRSSRLNDHPPTCTCADCREYRSKRKSRPTRASRPGHEWVACSMCGRTGEIISLGEGRPIRCPTCFRHGWVQRRDAPSNQSSDTEKESLTEAKQPNERSVDSLNSEEEERLTQAKQPDEESAGNLSDEGKEMLESLLEEVNRRAQRPKQPSEEKKGTEN